MPFTHFTITYKREELTTSQQEKLYTLLQQLEETKKDMEESEISFGYVVENDSRLLIEFDEEETKNVQEVETLLNESGFDWDGYHPRFWGNDALKMKRRNGVTYSQNWHPEYQEAYLKVSDLKGILQEHSSDKDIADVMKRLIKESEEFENL